MRVAPGAIGVRQDGASHCSALARRLQAARIALEKTESPDGELAERILKARARLVAKPETAASPLGLLDVVAFSVGGADFAFEARHVERVQVIDRLTPLPGVLRFVCGIASLHGEILAIVDLCEVLESGEGKHAGASAVIVLRSSSMRFGVLIDSLSGVRQLPASTLQRGLPTLNRRQERYLLGVAEEGLVVLDAAQLLSDGRLVIEERVPQRDLASLERTPIDRRASDDTSLLHAERLALPREEGAGGEG